MVTALVRTLEWALSCLGVYRLAIAAAAAGWRAPVLPEPESMRLLVLIPAHDEELSVARAVRSILSSAGRHRIRVVVVADNCSDLTAERAAAAGAEVLERADARSPGKSQALNWALERLRPIDADGVCFVDADCWVDPDFATAIARRIATGADAVQSDYRLSLGDGSAVAALRVAGYLLTTTLRPRGKDRLGLSAGLSGSGMAFRSELIERVSWPEDSIVEDAALHLELVERGLRVGFAGETCVWSETPASHSHASSQVERWDAGRARLARSRFAPAFAAGLRSRDPRRVHAALELLIPPESVTALANLGLIGLALAERRPGAVRRAVAVVALQPAFVLSGLRAVGAPRRVYSALVEAPRLVAERVGLYSGMASRGGPEGFVRTRREGVVAADAAR